MRTEFCEALKKAGDLKELSKEELVVLIDADEEESAALFSLADQVRKQFMGDEVHIRGIIEFSNYCANNCLYCGLRRNNRQLARYRMTMNEILDNARQAAGLGCRTIVLQSGEDSYYTADILAETVYLLKKEMDVAVTLSIGDRPREDYEKMREAGADRYLLKHETCDAELFAGLRPGTSLAERVERLKWLGELGFQVGSGNMVGLPGQTVETLAGDILLMRETGVEMAGIGPFVPNSQTPLGECPGGKLALTLKTLAAARLALPRVHMPATTAAGTIDPSGRDKALRCGANVIMPNMTPAAYKADYQIYPGKPGLSDTPEESYAKAVKIVEKAGRRVGRGYGHSDNAYLAGNFKLPAKN
ncbi:[FeFe] hydrogenase H-cluster radical SAM maturase HydE [Pelotomaculum terephthalicicum JT]|uniref:[FeFe] hydrogenase H-cluster radical SAM maturase HydE n=1 Tax=Pelotomaculum TaxID=191373 RepID=UPI0009C8FD5E|nr:MULTISPECIES: [FeFe] hydrogenase H-cluster radical SAM maturase HydE [Pelotomaculum]MCG9967181.1 [FeFe] hydrogenase H-cluster radical SAM maturase HydE [Pelotomaculum terephthalicicum JT]OPX90646.1 MAG: Biotin synthase [Pelotomaculum sp. PtaB.Bin117]OPY62094.1 MAG: Biotin synthase [Pelotomaculum sp. PtaU1.Bin065]